jgi:hypothetical protein
MPAIHSQQGLAEPSSGMDVWFKYKEVGVQNIGT